MEEIHAMYLDWAYIGRQVKFNARNESIRYEVTGELVSYTVGEDHIALCLNVFDPEELYYLDFSDFIQIAEEK